MFLDHAGTSIAFAPKKRSLFIGAWDSRVYSSALDGISKDVVPGVAHFLLPLDVGSRGEVIFGQDDGNAVVVWEPGPSRAPNVLYHHGSRVFCVAISGDLVVSGDNAGNVVLFDRISSKVRSRWNHTGGGVFCVAFSPDGSRVASAGSGGKVVIQSSRGTEEVSHSGFATSVAFSPNGRYLATSGGTYWSYGETKLWDLSSGKPVLCGQPLEHPNVVVRLSFSPNSELLAVTDDYIAGTIRVVNVPTLTERFSIKGHNMQTSAIDFLPPDGSRMMTASADGTVKFWDMAGAQVGSLTVQEQVRNARFTQDGNAIVTASTEGFVRIWRALPRPLNCVGNSGGRRSKQRLAINRQDR